MSITTAAAFVQRVAKQVRMRTHTHTHTHTRVYVMDSVADRLDHSVFT